MNRTLINTCGNTSLHFTERPNVAFRLSPDAVGRGASCIVYHAIGSDNTEHLLKEYYPKHLALERDSSGHLVAPPEQQQAFAEGLTRFCNSCRLQTEIRLSSPGLKNFTCNIQGYYCANGTAYLDMTCFSGQTYDHVQEESVYTLMLRMKALAKVIGNYHKAGLLHLDIKPENIYVRPEDETAEDVMLFDFDSVTPMSEVLSANALSCTKTWAAPEQLLPEKRKSICAATDLFAIGEIIFVQLFGRHSTSAERRSFVTGYNYDYSANIFKDINPKVFPLLDELLLHTITGVVEARYPSAEALIAQIDAVVSLADPKAAYLKSNLPAVQDVFVGRDGEIEEIHRMLNENNILFLNGIGGIGKSELAKHYAKVHMENGDYDTVIFAPYISDVNMLLQDDNATPLYNFAPYPEEKPEEYCARKLRKLQELCDAHTLFIVDNLDCEDDPGLHKLLNLDCKLLITTRADFSDYGYGKQLYLDALRNRSSILELFYKHYTKPLTKEEADCVEQIIDLVAGHTMTVELLAKQMMAGRVKPDKMLAKLQEGGISESGKEKVRAGKDGVFSAQSAYGHIQALFDLSELNEDEKYILANLSLIPYTGIPAELFHDWCELDSYDTINNLATAGWIKYNKTQDTIAVHPLISEICAAQCLSAEVVATLAETVSSLLLETEYFRQEEIALYSPIFFSISKRMLQSNITSNTAKLIFRISNFFYSNTGNVEYALDIEELALDWELSHIADNELFRLRVSSFLTRLSGHKNLFGINDKLEKRLLKWHAVYKETCTLDESENDLSVEEVINRYATLASHFENAEDAEKSVAYHKKAILLFASLSAAELASLYSSEHGCDAVLGAAKAYEVLNDPEQAKQIYFRLLSNQSLPPQELAYFKEAAYLGILGILIDAEDWEAGLYWCEQYKAHLDKHYPPNHKSFLLYYQEHLSLRCCLLSSKLENDCTAVSPQQLLDLVDAVWTYKAFSDQYYDHLTHPDYHVVSGLAHMLFGYVLTNFKDDANSNNAPQGINFATASSLLNEAKKLFELVDNQDEVNEVSDYLAYIEEKSTNN
ncbi:MAG: hypothetical protein IKU07_01755 [Oscillospiraceae bacterium]|nr:hypothetical protein [Oscillospiraceae bacterium]